MNGPDFEKAMKKWHVLTLLMDPPKYRAERELPVAPQIEQGPMRNTREEAQADVEGFNKFKALWHYEPIESYQKPIKMKCCHCGDEVFRSNKGRILVACLSCDWVSYE